MIPNQNILTELTNEFKAVAENAVAIITPYALNTLLIITIISIIVTTLNFLAIEDSRNPDILLYAKKNLPNLFKYASFTFLITFYGDIINAFIVSFFKIGGIAGGIPITDKIFSNPSLISETGLKLMLPIWDNYLSKNIGNIIVDITLLAGGAVTGGLLSTGIKMVNTAMGTLRPNSLILLVFMAFITLAIIGCFFIMAINIFVIQIEFAIIASISLILIPFGTWDYTAFIFDKAKSTFINIGIKYMVLTTIMSLSMSIISTLTLTDFPSYAELLYLFLIASGLTAMTIFLPSKIAAEMQG